MEVNVPPFFRPVDIVLSLTTRATNDGKDT